MCVKIFKIYYVGVHMKRILVFALSLVLLMSVLTAFGCGEQTTIIHFDVNLETCTDSFDDIEVVYEQSIGELPTPSAEGKIFSGWFYNDAQVNSGQVWLYSANEMTLKAHWVDAFVPSGGDGDTPSGGGETPSGGEEPPVIQVYSITYNLDGGVMDGEQTNTYAEGTEVELPKAKKSGMAFDGWKIVDDGGNPTGDVITKLPDTFKGNVKLIAIYSNVEITVNFVLTKKISDSLTVQCVVNGKKSIEPVVIKRGQSLGDKLPMPQSDTNKLAIKDEKNSDYGFLKNCWKIQTDDSYCYIDTETVFDDTLKDEKGNSIFITDNITIYVNPVKVWIGPY